MAEFERIPKLIQEDQLIGSIADAYRFPPLEKRNTTVWQQLTSSIISQQLSVKAAKTIYGRFIKLFDSEQVNHESLLKIGDDDLRAAGLSKQKIGYVRNIAEYALDHSDLQFNEMSDEDVVSKLTEIKGVGVWTVHMLMIFHLHRPNILAMGDLIVRRGVMKVFDTSDESKKAVQILEERAQRWSPHLTYISRLMWAMKDDILNEK